MRARNVAELLGALVLLGVLGAESAAGGGKPSPAPAGDPAIAFVSSRSDHSWNYSELKVVDADGANPKVLLSRRERIGTSFVDRITDPDWSPDGMSLVFKIGGEGLSTVNRDGTGLRQIIQDPVGIWGDPAWSPLPVPGALGGGKVRIAYLCIPQPANSYSTTDLYLLDPDGSDVVRVTDTPGVGEEAPSWSPSGTRLALNLYKNPPALADRTIGIYDFVTDTLTEVAPGGGLAGATILDPSWSRTSESRIALRALSPDGTGWDLWVLDLNDLDHPVNITNTPAVREGFVSCWSPDDSQIVFDSAPVGSGVVSIEVVNADGTGRHTISAQGAYPAWRRNP